MGRERTGAPGVEVLDRPDRVDLVPSVVGVVDPGPEQRDPFADVRHREAMSRHGLRDELAVLPGAIVAVQESGVPIGWCDVDVVVAVLLGDGPGNRSDVPTAGGEHMEPVWVIDTPKRAGRA
jgi:hypothetical protein